MAASAAVVMPPSPRYVPSPDNSYSDDDDFEEEIKGEYDLADDQYGQEFNKEFGHLTNPDATPPKKSAENKKDTGKKKQ